MTTIFDIPGTNPPNPFAPIIDGYLSSWTTTAADQTASRIISKVTTSPNPRNALYHLWDAFSTSVVHTTTSTSFTPHLTLLSSIRSHAPTKPTALAPGSSHEKALLTSRHLQSDGFFDWSRLPLFPEQCSDTHDILEAWRDWDGVRAAGATGVSTLDAPPAEYFVRFVTFSALLLSTQTGHADGGATCIHPISVFYAARNILEREGMQAKEDGEPGHTTGGEHRLDVRQVWELDVRVAAIWLKGRRRRWSGRRGRLLGGC